MIFGKAKIRELERRIAKLEAENEQLKNRPAPAKEEPKADSRHAYKSVWTNLSESYDSAVAHVIGPVEEEQIRKAAEDTVRVLEQTIGINETDSILEIGCGIGRVGQALAPRCAKWIGCDVSPNMLGFAKQRLESFENVELHEISGYDLQQIPDASVNAIYCTVVFMHIEEWDRYNYILEAFRVLKPGGRILVDNFSLTTEMGWGMFEELRKFPADARPAHISKSSTSEELQAYLNHAGFCEVETIYEDLWIRGWARKSLG